MLMIWCHNSWSDNSTVRYRVTNINGIGRKNTCGTDFIVNLGGLCELEGEDIFVVADSNNALEDEYSRAGYNCIICAEVGMLPQDPVIYFMATNNVWKSDRISCQVVKISREVLDTTKTITSFSNVSTLWGGKQNLSTLENLPNCKLFAFTPAPLFPKSKAAFLGYGLRESPYGTNISERERR